jgi:hypothetical protein
MATNTQWAASLLDEAAAIVEAEWMRLQQDEALWEREIADLLAEMPAPRPSPPCVGATTTARRRSGQPMPDDRRRRPTRRWPPMPVWATQRSPPSQPGVQLKGTVGRGLSDKGGDAPDDDHRRQRRHVSAHNDSRCRVTAADSSVQSRSAHAPPLEVAYRSGPCTTSLPSQGRPQDRSPVCPGIINEHQ